MDRDHRASTFGQRRAHRVRIQQQMLVVDVGEHRQRARAQHRLGGGHEGVHRQDDLVSTDIVTGSGSGASASAGTDAGRAQRQLDSVGAVAHTHAVPDTTEVGVLALEGGNLLPTDKRGGREHLVEPGPHLLGDLGLCSRQIHQRNRGHRDVPSMG